MPTKNTVRECSKCEQRFLYWWFEGDGDVCGFCRPEKETKDG